MIFQFIHASVHASPFLSCSIVELRMHQVFDRHAPSENKLEENGTAGFTSKLLDIIPPRFIH
jgi:hypothetical protein